MHNAVSILTPKRDRPSLHSFSIRDLMLVTVIVVLAVGWWVDRNRLANEIDLLKSQSRLRVPKYPLLKREQQQIQRYLGKASPPGFPFPMDPYRGFGCFPGPNSDHCSTPFWSRISSSLAIQPLHSPIARNWCYSFDTHLL